jgi:hypothetical protein
MREAILGQLVKRSREHSSALAVEAGAEIDLHFQPKTLAQTKGRN